MVDLFMYRDPDASKPEDKKAEEEAEDNAEEEDKAQTTAQVFANGDDDEEGEEVEGFANPAAAEEYAA